MRYVGKLLARLLKRKKKLTGAMIYISGDTQIPKNAKKAIADIEYVDIIDDPHLWK
jgi:hypothetical protein